MIKTANEAFKNGVKLPLHYVRNNTVLNPLHGIGGRIEHKYRQHYPSSRVYTKFAYK